jgi:hypothetical protein
MRPVRDDGMEINLKRMKVFLRYFGCYIASPKLLSLNSCEERMGIDFGDPPPTLFLKRESQKSDAPQTLDYLVSDEHGESAIASCLVLLSQNYALRFSRKRFI